MKVIIQSNNKISYIKEINYTKTVIFIFKKYILQKTCFLFFFFDFRLMFGQQHNKTVLMKWFCIN